MSEITAVPLVFELLLTLPVRKLADLGRFLASPYFNQRDELQRLWTLLAPLVKQRAPGLPKAQLWQSLYPDRPYSDQTLRLLFSDLLRLVEQFVAVEATLNDPFELKMKVAESLGAQPDDGLHARWLKEAQRLLQRQTHRHAEHLYRVYRHQAEVYRLAFSRQPEKDDNLAALTPTLERAFLAMKLRQNVWLLNHDQVYRWGYQPSALDAWLAAHPPADLQHEPALRIYAYGLHLLQQPHHEAAFRQFQQALLADSHLFPEAEARDLYLLAINFGIRQVNAGRRAYFPGVMDLYKTGLEAGYLLRNGVLSRFTYHNIAAIALQMGEIDWVESFLETWTPRLERRFRERMYHFNRAKVAYARRRYHDALPLLQQANYHDPLLNLGARTLLLKIYYELGEWEALQSHLDAFQHYLRRKPDLGYHAANYRNLIRFTGKLLATAGQPHKRARLREEIAREATLTEKEWLLGVG